MNQTNNEEMAQDKLKIIKYSVLDFLGTHLKYYISDKDEFKREQQKIYDALKDLFANVPLEQMTDERFTEHGRFEFLCRKCRQPWGKKILIGIYKNIFDRL
jgi:hypothetical protein